ncbi:MAG: TetR family transcriptional regulator [Mycetocola sp.]
MPRQSLRERQRLALRGEIQSVAIYLFLDRGFDEVAVTEIAETAGVSDRTFYRYFATKEDVVLVLLDEWAPIIHAHLRDHEGEDRPWKVVCDAFLKGAAEHATVDSRVMKMIYENPRLTAAYFERQRTWEALAAEVIAERLGVDAVTDPRPSLWAMIAFDVAFRVWYDNVILAPDRDPLAHLEDRFRKAEEFFSGRLA